MSGTTHLWVVKLVEFGRVYSDEQLPTLMITILTNRELREISHEDILLLIITLIIFYILITHRNQGYRIENAILTALRLYINNWLNRTLINLKCRFLYDICLLSLASWNKYTRV